MQKSNINLNIETLVLVAIWKTPFIFQGRFNISNKQDNSIKPLFFRCECHLEDKMHIIDLDFSPDDYKFTHLLNHQSAIELINVGQTLEQALYVLKYALKVTLEKMIMNPKQYLAYFDEVAMSSVSQEIERLMISHEQNAVNDDIGFAVAVDFSPTESMGQMAALALVGINEYSECFEGKGRVH